MKRYLLLLFAFGCLKINYAQEQESPELPMITSHSPEVASLGRYGDYPVDYRTGIPQIEIPLYTIKSGSLELPISVSYHSGGIKVDQESSFVGLGWVLNAGGVISRVIRDKHDELWTDSGFLTRGGILPDYNSITDDLPHGLIGNDPDPANDGPIRTNFRLDKEPDIFTIQSKIISGRFCLDNSLNYVSTTYSPLKYDVDVENNLIEVTDEKGNLFRFGKSLENEDAFETSSVIVDNGSGDVAQGPYDSGYYLTEIISANKQDTIKFKYKSCYYTGSRSIMEQRWIPVNPLFGDQGVTEKQLYKTTIPNTRVIDSIIFKNGYITFSKATDRLDVSYVSPEEYIVPRVTGFTVFDIHDNQVQRIEFENDHHFDRPTNHVGFNNLPIDIGDIRRKSLKLNGINFYGRNDGFVQDFNFEYDQTPMSPRYSISQDFWGYYNGNQGGNVNSLIPETFYYMTPTKPIYLGDNRATDFDYMKAGILTKVIYPTKGYTTYEYEPNYYLTEEQALGNTTKTRSVSLAAINRLSSCPPGYFDGVPVNNSIEFDVTEDLGASYVWGELTIEFSDYVLPNDPNVKMQCRLTDLDGSDVYLFEHEQADKTNTKVLDREKVKIMPGHRYKLEVLTNGVSGSVTSICDSPYVASTLTYDYFAPATPQEITPKQAGGLRIKTITNYDSDNLVILKNKYEYGDTAYGPNGLGVGNLITDPSKNFFYFPRLYYTGVNQAHLENVIWFAANSQIELGTNNGSPVDYSKVTEYTIVPTNTIITNGKTEYYYSPTGRNVDMSWATVNRPYDRFIYPDWKESTIQENIFYKQKDDLSYETVKSITYGYEDLPEQRIKTLIIRGREPEIYAITDVGGRAESKNSPDRFYYYNSYVSTGKRILTSEITKEYENGIETLITTKNYNYGNTEHLQPTEITTSDSEGDILKTDITYPQDIAIGLRAQAEQDLIDTHRWATPIKTNIYRKAGANPEELLSQSYLVYKNWIGGINALELHQTAKDTDPLEDRIVYHDYYAHGHVKEVSKANGTRILYLWGYNNEYPIAKIENFESSQITPAIQNLITAAEDASNLDNDRTTGYSGNEGVLRQALDAIRNHTALSSAMVTTYTYDPLVGLTSITDPRKLTLYYEYDDYNRLKLVRDDLGNILSENDYHYKGQ